MATISNPYILTDYTMIKNLSSLGLSINGANDWSINGWCASNLGIALSTNTAIFSFKLSSTSYGATIGFERITSVRSIVHANVSKLKLNVEYTVLINYTSRSFQVMESGKYVNLVHLPGAFDFSYGASGDSWSNKWVISLSGTGRVKFDNLKYAVNLPDNTVMNYIEDELYLKDNEIYGMNNGQFMKLHNNWNSLSDVEKITLFRSTNHEKTALAKLSELGNFKILNLNEANYQQGYSITAVPKDQLIYPKKLNIIDTFEGINKAVLALNISSNAKCRVFVTMDLKTYQTYDAAKQEWEIVASENLFDVANKGINTGDLQSIPRSAWDKLTMGKAGIGFAYLLSIEDSTDICSIDKFELIVDMKGSWNKAFING